MAAGNQPVLSALTGAGSSAGSSPATNTTEDEHKLWGWLESLAAESSRVRREEGGFDDYDERIDMFYGKHWPSSIPSFRPPVVVNELRTLILSEASDLTESQPRIYITKDPRNGTRDEQLERAFRAVWARQQVDIKLMYACVWALTTGTSFLSVGWDPDEHHGLGDVTVDVVDSRTVLPDPDAVGMNADRTWLYVIREQIMDVHEIRRLFPVSGMRVTPDEMWSEKNDEGSPAGSSPVYLGPLTPSNSYMHGSAMGYKKARARVLDVIFKDDTTETVMVPDEMAAILAEPMKPSNGDSPDPETANGPTNDVVTGMPPEQQFKPELRAKYPDGRRIVMANGICLFDGGNPHPAGDFGLLRVVLEPCPDRFWGLGFVQQTRELQLAADKLASNVVENAVRLNNGIIVSTTNTGLDWETFAGIPAQIVQINPGSEFKIQYPPPMPADMIKAPWTMLDMQRRLLGFQDSRTGAGQRGNVSAELTETEISQSQSTTRLRARMLHAMVQRLAEMIFARMAYGYSQPRAIPCVDGEEFKPVVWEPLPDPRKYAVYVDPASFTVMSKTMIRRMSLLLRKMNVIDRKATLTSIGFPDADAIASRMDKAEAAAAAAKMSKGKK